MVLSIYTKNASNLTKRYLGMVLEGRIDGWTEGWMDGQKDGWMDDAKTISLRLHPGKTST